MINSGNRASEEHSLPGERRGTSQDTERKKERKLENYSPHRGEPPALVSEGCSRPGEHKRSDKSGHGMKPRERGVLTSWGAESRSGHDTEGIRGTYSLESTDGETSQDPK